MLLTSSSSSVVFLWCLLHFLNVLGLKAPLHMVTEQKRILQSEQVCTNAVQTKVGMCVCAEISPRPLHFLLISWILGRNFQILYNPFPSTGSAGQQFRCCEREATLICKRTPKFPEMAGLLWNCCWNAYFPSSLWWPWNSPGWDIPAINRKVQHNMGKWTKIVGSIS